MLCGSSTEGERREPTRSAHRELRACLLGPSCDRAQTHRHGRVERPRHELRRAHRPVLMQFCDPGTRLQPGELRALPGARPRLRWGCLGRDRAHFCAAAMSGAGLLRWASVCARTPFLAKTLRRSDDDHATCIAIAIGGAERRTKLVLLFLFTNSCA